MAYLILDRDGVINQDSDDYIKNPNEWLPIPGSLKAISNANRAGFRVIVVTNQSGLGRGIFDINTLNEMHKKMHKKLARVGGVIEAVFFCPHKPDEGCDCRKPKAGMLEEIRQRLNISLEKVWYVGDSYTDVQAARSAGATPVLVRTGKGERTLAGNAKHDLGNVPVYSDLAACVDALLQHNN
ncbi:MAG: D-glycero-beta-D-manno-heptose 1,7-bisphosphate 7-phosphatase [Gammaproteobacteria bacterium]